MKIQWYKRFICYLFIAILFASGMQVELDHSHSYFAYESKNTSPNQLHDNSTTFISSDYYSNELLQPRTTQYIKNNSAPKNVVRRIRSLSPTSILCTIKQNFFYFEKQHLSNICCSSFSQTIIIEYIHQQDGAK